MLDGGQVVRVSMISASRPIRDVRPSAESVIFAVVRAWDVGRRAGVAAAMLAFAVACAGGDDPTPLEDTDGLADTDDVRLTDTDLDSLDTDSPDTDVGPTGAQPFCVPSVEDGAWRRCVLDPTVSSASYVGDATSFAEFTVDGSTQSGLESPRDAAIGDLQDGRSLLIWTEFIRSTGLGCGLLQGNALVACPSDWFSNLRDLPLWRSPLLAELDGHPGLDAFITVLETGGRTAAEWTRDVEEGANGGTLPALQLTPMMFSFDGDHWVDRTEEVGLEPFATLGCVSGTFHLLDADNDGDNELIAGIESSEACVPPAWAWNDTTGTMDRVDPVTPPSLRFSFYGYGKGPVGPDGVSDFIAVSTGHEFTADGQTTSCWRGPSLRHASRQECPDVFAVSPMGLGFADLDRKGFADILTTDEGSTYFCDDVRDPFTVLDCYDSSDARGLSVRTTMADDMFISWAATGVDWSGDGWADVCFTGGWSTNQYHPQELACFESDGNHGFRRLHSPIFDAHAEERGLLVWAPPGRDAAPNLLPLDFNQETPWRFLGTSVPEGRMQHVLLENADGTPPCNAFAYATVGGAVQLLAAQCSYGYGSFPPAVWLPPGTTHLKIVWTDGAVSELEAVRGKFPAVIRRPTGLHRL